MDNKLNNLNVNISEDLKDLKAKCVDLTFVNNKYGPIKLKIRESILNSNLSYVVKVFLGNVRDYSKRIEKERYVLMLVEFTYKQDIEKINWQRIKCNLEQLAIEIIEDKKIAKEITSFEFEKGHSIEELVDKESVKKCIQLMKKEGYFKDDNSKEDILQYFKNKIVDAYIK